MRVGFALLAVSLLACGDEGTEFPVGGGNFDGGTGSGSGSGVDAKVFSDAKPIDAMPAAIDAAIFTGRVCLAADSRKLDGCATTGAGGLTVRLGSSSAVTAVDGTFMIAASNATHWVVTGSNIVTSVKRVGDYEIPALSRTLFNSMIANNLMPFPPNPGEGHVMAQLIRNGTFVSGATAEAPTTATWDPFYDGTSATAWTQAGTSTNGVVWIPNIDVGTVSVKFTSGTTDVTASGLPIEDGAITFQTIIFP